MRYISVALLLLSFNILSYPNIHFSSSKTSNKWMCGKIVIESFVDKGGRQHPEMQEYYFIHFDKKYFIKLSESQFIGSLSDYKDTYVRIHATIKSGLWDTDDPNVQSRIGNYITINHVENVEAPEKIIFIDFNNNIYEVFANRIKYEPISQAESSSGIYSGGEPKTVTIDTDTFMNIFFLAEAAVNNRQLHLIKRIKTSSVIKLLYSDNEITSIIIDSPEIQELIRYLHNKLNS